MDADYDIKKVLYAVTVGDEISTEPPAGYCVTADYHLYYEQAESEEWDYLAYGWEDVKDRERAGFDDTRLRRLYWLKKK